MTNICQEITHEKLHFQMVNSFLEDMGSTSMGIFLFIKDLAPIVFNLKNHQKVIKLKMVQFSKLGTHLHLQFLFIEKKKKNSQECNLEENSHICLSATIIKEIFYFCFLQTQPFQKMLLMVIPHCPPCNHEIEQKLKNVYLMKFQKSDKLLF